MIGKYGITIKYSKLMLDLNRSLNHGRRKKISIRRASPQMSRNELRMRKQVALIGAVLERGNG